jgi:hypothetical protein
MKWTEIELNQAKPLWFCNREIAVIERRISKSRVDILKIHFHEGVDLELDAAVDVSELLNFPRVFVFESAPRDMFALFGGEKMYWLTIEGCVKAEISTFREWGYEEYWKTQIIDRERQGILIVYEGGVLAIDETLAVRWHTPKLYNDELVEVWRSWMTGALSHKGIRILEIFLLARRRRTGD